MEYWRLTIQHENGSSIALCGSEEVLSSAMNEWHEWVETDEAVRDMNSVKKAMVIDACMDSFDRAPCRLMILKDTVIGMSLYRMSR